MKLENELHTKHISSPKQRAWLNLLVTTSRSSAILGTVFKKKGLTEQQFNVLRILRGKYPETVNLCDIQERMVDKNSNATRLVEKLRQKGLVERQTCENNRRKVDIRVTDDGLKLLSELDPEIEEVIDQLFRNLNEAEIRQLDGLLERFRG